MTEQQIKASYIRQVCRKCPPAVRKRMKRDLADSLSDYFEEHPGASMDEIRQHFGAPDAIGDEQLLAMDEDSRTRIVSRAAWVRRVILAAAAAVILIVAVAAGWIVYVNSQSVPGYYIEYISDYNRVDE